MTPTAAPPTRRARVIAALLDQALAALRGGHLDAWRRQRPRAGRRLLAPVEAVIRAAAGDALPDGAASEPVLRIALTWLLVSLRPDAHPGLDAIDDDAWLRRPVWRPALAALCHHGLLAVPDFPGRYRRRPEEPAIDNLCGLWDLAPSTLYRDLERAQATMREIALARSLPVPRRLALRRVAFELTQAPGADAGADAARHRRGVRRALERQDPESALWHAWQAGDVDAALDVLRDHAPALAAGAETDALVERLAASPAVAGVPQALARLWLARAVIARTRGQPGRDLAAIETALRIATAAADAPLQGVAYGALGKFHEARDADRAFACYERSAELLAAGAPGFEAEALRTLVRLAWLYALRQHPRTREVLEQADRLVAGVALGARDRALLDDAWGEYWRLSGRHREAVDARQRALLGFEAAGDRRQVLATLLNLALTYVHGQDNARALEVSARFFAEAEAGDVEPEMLVNAHGNVGIAHFFLGDLDRSAEHYREAVRGAEAADLRLHTHRNRYNLAETLYHRFRQRGDAADEAEADALVAAILAAPAAEASEMTHDVARRLKDEVMAPPPTQVRDRLLSDEAAEHFDDAAEVERQRAALAAAADPAAQVQARLRIAEAYVAMAARERDRALALAGRHGLEAQARPALARLRAVFEREQPREARLAAGWESSAGDLLDANRRLALAARLLADGALSKASYGEAAGVSPATASKHLAILAQRGLLVQSGKGPATRYRLSSAEGLSEP